MKSNLSTLKRAALSTAAGPQTPPSLSRRRFLSLGAGGAALLGAPHVWAKKAFKLRVLGTHVTLQEPLRMAAEKDLGIQISFEPGGSARVLHRASSRPDTFDVYEQWSNSINILWTAEAIRPIDTKRIERWDDVNSLAKSGKLTPKGGGGRGDAPHKILYVQKDNTLGKPQTQRLSFLPYVHNVDSFGYNVKKLPRGIPYETESWGILLDESVRGKVALVNAPTIGLFDAALAAQAKGLVTFDDIGAMRREELDRLFDILIQYKREGHFRGVWSSVPQSVALMRRGEVVVESMFSPAVSALNASGAPGVPVECVYAAPKEGYRAWHGVMCLSSAIQKPAEDAAYAYMNWWLSGWPGAFIARQGYYISTAHLSRPHLSEDEWNYWYGGQPTKTDLKNTAGEVAVKAGSRRTGGSYEERFEHVAVWNTVMNQYEHSLQRWNEFLLS